MCVTTFICSVLVLIHVGFTHVVFVLLHWCAVWCRYWSV